MKPLNVLLIGSGGREHALARKLKESPYCAQLHVGPGNAGMCDVAQCHAVVPDNPSHVVSLAKSLNSDFVVIGGEPPLVAGVVDALAAHGIPAMGPTRAAAELEGSKAFMKAVVVAAGIPTATHKTFDDAAAAKADITARGAPIVIKTDGLAAGKGVTVAMTLEEAHQAVDEAMVSKVFADAGSTVVVEDYLEGPEISVFALCDGVRAVCLGAAQDHKRVGDGDAGPNTGGMGAYSPVRLATPAFLDDAMARFVTPLLAEMQRRGAPYRGILYVGLMVTEQGPKLIEYNVRFGDPETQVIVPRLDNDLLELFWLSAHGALDKAPPIRFHADAALTVVMAANGYPGNYQKGTVIGGLDAANAVPNAAILHAGTQRNADGQITAYGGRVLNAVGMGTDLRAAQSAAYAALEKIEWPDGFYRRDIGWRELT